MGAELRLSLSIQGRAASQRRMVPFVCEIYVVSRLPESKGCRGGLGCPAFQRLPGSMRLVDNGSKRVSGSGIRWHGAARAQTLDAQS